MEAIKRILLTSPDKKTALEQAIFNASSMQAELTCLSLVSKEPDVSATQALIAQMQQSVQKACNEQAIDIGTLTVHYAVIPSKHIANEIIHQVLRHDFQLVIKAVEQTDSTGFHSTDMQLLRKCPCPLWLSREQKNSQPGRIAVAIDPQYDEPCGQTLSLDLLQLTALLAIYYQRKPWVFSCWYSDIEGSLGNPFLQLDEAEAREEMEQDRQAHLKALQALIQQSGINADVAHEKGQARKLIPQMVKEQQIDLLIMGTVARTGIPGFIIGNTAESILSRLECSVLAIKPEGFVSPVRL